MKRLMLAFPYPTVDPQTARMRSDLYREHLGHLDPGHWLKVVDEAIEHEHERTFPPVAVLAGYARSTPQPRLLPLPRRTPEEIEAGREEAKKFLEKIKALATERLSS